MFSWNWFCLVYFVQTVILHNRSHWLHLREQLRACSTMHGNSFLWPDIGGPWWFVDAVLWLLCPPLSVLGFESSLHLSTVGFMATVSVAQLITFLTCTVNLSCMNNTSASRDQEVMCADCTRGRVVKTTDTSGWVGIMSVCFWETALHKIWKTLVLFYW